MPRQLHAQESATSAQSRHHGTDWDVQRLRRFAIGEPLDIHQQDQCPEVLRQTVERRLDGLGGQDVRRWRVDEDGRLACGVEIDEKRLGVRVCGSEPKT
jgi:hypothetical protein